MATRKNAKYSEDEVARQLNKKHDVTIIGGIIYVLRGQKATNDLGIKSKGKIDFLTNYCGYRKMFVDEFSH